MMTDHGEPWDNQGHHSNVYDANGDCIATVFNHRARIIACVNALKGTNPEGFLGLEDIKYLIGRLKRSIELIDADEPHMAVAKLLADISALKSVATNCEEEQ